VLATTVPAQRPGVTALPAADRPQYDCRRIFDSGAEDLFRIAVRHIARANGGIGAIPITMS
jgi:hypothetical protein